MTVPLLLFWAVGTGLLLQQWTSIFTSLFLLHTSQLCHLRDPPPPTPLTDFVFVAILIENNHSQPCGEQKGKKSPDIWVCQYASGVSKHYFSFSSSLLVVVEAGAIPFLKEFTVEKNQSFEGKELINGNGVWILSFSFHVSHALLESDT